MTQITVFSQDSYITGFRIEGHSGYAEAGSDIVCAAISALAITAVNALEEILDIEPETDMGDGLMLVRLPRCLNSAVLPKAEMILRTAVIGFQSVAQEYPKYVCILNGGARR